MDRYDDILLHPHYQDARHKPMSMMSRAAQFSSFAALTGYEDAIDETARLTDCRHELTEDEQQALNDVMQRLADDALPMPVLSVIYFVPDEKKSGGTYMSMFGKLRMLDTDCGMLRFEGGEAVPIDDLLSVQILADDDEPCLPFSEADTES